MKSLTINHLESGGLITNYYCSSQCRHCLYACSPRWEKKYIKIPEARETFSKIFELGCYSIHIGGGEPFLNIESLKQVLKTAYEENIRIEYVETNSSWYRDRAETVETLAALKKFGLSTLLISMSPFHNEYIPFSKVKGVLEACEEAGVYTFPWVQNFYDDINSFDDTKPHSLDEYLQAFGPDYLRQVPSRVWMHMGGRAITLFQESLPGIDTEEIIASSQPCDELADVTHFHFDCFGNYLPGLCSGMAIARSDLGKPLDSGKYPFITILHEQGIGALLEYARREHEFISKNHYISKCHLCLDIRKYLVLAMNVQSADLAPEEFYLFT